VGRAPVTRGALESTPARILFPTIGGLLGGLSTFGAAVPIGAATGEAVRIGLSQAVEGEGFRVLPEAAEGIPFAEAAERIKVNLLEEGAVQRINPDDDFEDSILGGAIKEGLFTVVGGQVFKRLGPVFKATSKKLSNINLPENKVIQTVGKFYDDAVKVAGKSKEKFINKLALINERVGVKNETSKRILTRGPSKTLGKHIESLDPNLNKSTIDSVSKSFDTALESLNEEFTKEVTPILNKIKDPIDIDNIIRQYSDDVSEILQVDQTGKLIARAPVDNEIAKTFNDFSQELTKLRSDSTPLKVHKFKQFINKVLKKKAISENSSARNVLTNTHKSIRNLLDDDDVVPGYKALTNKFRSVFELEEQFGRKLENRTEAFINEYFAKDRVDLRSAVQDFMSKNKAVKNSIDKALDERAAKDFISLVRQGRSMIGIGRVGLPGPTRLGQARRLLRTEEAGRLFPLGRVIQPPAAIGIGQAIEQPIEALGGQ